MALSGSKTGTTGNTYIDVKVNWSATQSIANNNSVVTAIAYVRKDSASTSDTYSGSPNYKLYIAGVVEGTRTSAINIPDDSVWREICRGSRTISHDAAGNASFSIDLTGTDPDTISFTKTTYALDTIPRASIPTLNTATAEMDGGLIRVYTNRASTGFLHTVTWYFGAASGYIGTQGAVADYADFYPAVASMASQIPAATSGVGAIHITTYQGGSQIGSTQSISFTATLPASVKPSFSTAATSTGTVASVGKAVQGLCSKTVTAGTAAAGTGSSIASYVYNYNGVDTTSTSPTFNTGTLNWSGSRDVIITVKDARGRTASQTHTISDVMPYAVPSLTLFTVQRCQSDGTPDVGGTYIKVARRGSATSLMNGTEKNAITGRVYYKESTASTYNVIDTLSLVNYSTNVATILNGDPLPYTKAGGFDFAKAYNFKFEVSDTFTPTPVSSIVSIGTGGVIMSFGSTGVGFGKVIDNATAALDIKGDVYTEGNLYTKGSIHTITSPFAKHIRNGCQVRRNTIIPRMGSNVGAYGAAASASSEYNVGSEAFQAFAENPYTQWHATPADGAPWVLQYAFPGGWMKLVKSYSMSPLVTGTPWMARSWTFEGSNDGGTWTVINTQSNITFATGETKFFDCASNTTSYRYFRLNISQSADVAAPVNEYCTVGNWSLYETAVSNMVSVESGVVDICGYYGLYWPGGTLSGLPVSTTAYIYLRVEKATGILSLTSSTYATVAGLDNGTYLHVLVGSTVTDAQGRPTSIVQVPSSYIWNTIGNFGMPQFLTNWGLYTPDLNTWGYPGFMKDSTGRVHLRGLALSADAVSNTLFTLPIGFRPSEGGIYPVMVNQTIGRMDVLPSGNVNRSTPLVASWYSIEGINFIAEN